MVNILAIDTSVGPCSAAVWKNGHIAAYFEDPGQAVQSARLMPMVEQALKTAGLTYKDLSAVACTIGPGSFTGIRVGLAATRGIAFAANIKGMGFTTLETLAFAARKTAAGKSILAAINAGKGECYYQGFDADPWRARFAPQVGVLKSIDMPAGFVTVGNTAEPIIFPRADILCELAAFRGQEAAELMPVYIRPPDAKPMKETG